MIKMERKYGLDILKIMATIIIVFHHYQQITGTVFEGINFYGGKFYFGYVVELFFVISGYVIYPYVNKIREKSLRLSEFYLNRFIRLFPMVSISAIGYELFLYIYVCRMGHEFFREWCPTLWGTVLNSLMMQCGWGFTNPEVNNPTWYISVLMLCYVLFYVLVSIARKYKFDVIYLFGVMVLLGVAINTYSLQLPLLNGDTYRGFYSFFWGLILRRLMPIVQEKIMKHKFFALFVGIITSVIIPLLIYKEHIIVSSDINYLVTFIYYTVIICLLEMLQTNCILKCPFLKTLSEISFNVYLWHITLLIVMYIIIWNFLEGQTWFLCLRITMYLFTIASFICGSISYYFIEKPIVSQIEKRSKARQTMIK